MDDQVSHTMPDVLERLAFGQPDAIVTVDPAGARRAAELNGEVDALVGTLLGAGIGSGDRVALCGENSALFLVIYFAVLRLGAVIVPLNSRWKMAQVRSALALVSPQLLIWAMPGDELPVVPTTTTLVVATDGRGLRSQLGAMGRRGGDRGLARLQGGQLAALLFTGGTTGTLKAAMLSHSNLMANARQFATAVGIGREDVVAATLPWFHAFGLTVTLNAPLLARSRIAIGGRFEPASCRDFIRDQGVTVLPAVPPMLEALGGAPHANQLRMAICGAGRLDEVIRERFEAAFGAPVVEGYGLTEASPVTHCNPPWAVRKGSVGVALPHTEVLLKELDSEAPVTEPGRKGEVLIRGPQVMLGYWNAPQESAEVLRDGWLYTGDVGVVDEAGYLRIVDRQKRMVKIKGENVYPARVEEVLMRHPGISDIAVISRASEPERLMALYVSASGIQEDSEALRRYCQGALSSIEIPQHWVAVERLPRSAVGKLLWVEVEQMAAAY